MTLCLNPSHGGQHCLHWQEGDGDCCLCGTSVDTPCSLCGVLDCDGRCEELEVLGMSIPAISIHEPYASAFLHGAKTIETRTWAPPLKHIGKRIAIHATKNLSEVKRLLRDGDYPHLEVPIINTGHVLCTARLAWVGKVTAPCVTDPSVVFGERHDGIEFYAAIEELGDFSVGRYLWKMVDVQPLEPPVLATGHQGIWYWDGVVA